MNKLFQIMFDRLNRGEDLVLVTVIASSGATPRGVGARMLVGKQGRIYGTIGGGAVEYRSEKIARDVLEKKSSLEQAFSLTREDVQNLGMICGGDVLIFFSYISCQDAHTLALLQKALASLSKGEPLWLLSDIGQGGKLALYSRQDGCIGIELPEALHSHLNDRPHRVKENDFDLYVEQIGTPGRVYIFGGGHVAQELEPVLSHVGFRCVVMDDREEFAKRELFPTAEEVILVDFSQISHYVTIGEADYVCVMTRGHAYDTIIQAQILKCRPKYVGVIGSRSKAAGVRKVLKEEYSLSDELLDRVTTPIGLSIGAQTPEEIAISIAGQIIAVRAGKQ